MTSFCIIIGLLAKLASSQIADYSSDYVSPASSNYEEDKGYMVQYRPGDILIGGMLRVHKRGPTDHCGTILEDGVQTVETMNMVIDEINRNSTLLPGITLGSVIIDTCDADTHALQRAVEVFFPYFFQGTSTAPTNIPLFAGVVGAASSGVSISTASLLQIFKIPQVSPWSTHPILSNKNRFPYFFRTVPSDAYQAVAMLKLVTQQNWNYLSVVYEDDFYGSQGFREVEEEAEKVGVCIATAQSIPRTPGPNDFKRVVDELVKVKEAKAVVVFTKRTDAENLLLAAHNHPSVRPGDFLWIGSDGWSGQIPDNENTEYLETLNGAVTLSPMSGVISNFKSHMRSLTLGQHLSAAGNVSARNPWFPEYLSRHLNCLINGTKVVDNTTRICLPEDRVNENTFFTLSLLQQVADAALALANSLRKEIQTKCNGRVELCAAINRTSGQNTLANGVYEIMKNISFIGINGNNITFDKHQDGPALYDVKIFNNNNNLMKITQSVLEGWENAGTFSDNNIQWNEGDSLNDKNISSVCSAPCDIGQARIIESAMCCWQCQPCHDNQYVENETSCVDCGKGFIPTTYRNDCVAVPVRFTTFGETYSIASMSLAVFGLLLTLLVAAVFCKYHDTPIVKASGKELCFIILLGAISCFADSFVLAAPASIVTCSLSRILLALGPTLMYASLITKTIRVVIIFKAKKLLSPQVKAFLLPKYQVLTTIALSLLQLFIIAAWLGLSIPDTDTIFPTPVTAFLTCKNIKNLLVLVGLIYPIILIIICTILATINRNVPTGFNETQYIGFTMYATCVIWLAFLPIFITNSSNISLKVATLSICLSLSAITVLVCLFGFRCYVILFKSENNTSKSVMSSVNARSFSQRDSQSARKSQQEKDVGDKTPASKEQGASNPSTATGRPASAYAPTTNGQNCKSVTAC